MKRFSPLSPFSTYFHDLRRRYRVSQRDLAKKMGYEQGYISGLEVGKKGPPNKEFVEKLIKALNLSKSEQELLRESVEDSQRRYVLPGNAPIDLYRLMRRLWSDLEYLHPAQIRAMNEILSLQDRMEQPAHLEEGRSVYRKQREEAKM